MAEMLENREETNRSLEDIFQELDGIIEKMQDREVTLEEAFGLYEKGMTDVRRCNEKLDLVEKKMLAISKEGDLVPFEE